MRLINAILGSALVVLLLPTLALGQADSGQGSSSSEDEASGEEQSDRSALLLLAVDAFRKRRLTNIDTYVEKRAKHNFFDPAANVTDGDIFTMTPPQAQDFDGEGTTCSWETCTVYKVETEENDGIRRKRARALSGLEVAVEAGISPGAEVLEGIGETYLRFQRDFNEILTDHPDPYGNLDLMARYIFPHSTNPATSEELDVEQPWTDPFAFIGGGGMMMIDTAWELRKAERSVSNSQSSANTGAANESRVIGQLEPAGVENFDGTPAARFTASSLAFPESTVDGCTIAMNSLSLWIDPERLVSLGHRFEGTQRCDGEISQFFIQLRNSDFRNPAGCYDMLEPYTRVMEIGGVLNDEQMAQMEEAKRQLEEFDRQMASLPAAQRKMMESMMGSQMDTVRNMAESGAISHTMEIEEIICNPDLMALFAFPGSGGSVQSADDNLLRQIQKDLTTLGYKPGNTDGVLDTMTQVAISQFEAEQEMPVTGEPSNAVAAALASAVAAQ